MWTASAQQIVDSTWPLQDTMGESIFGTSKQEIWFKILKAQDVLWKPDLIILIVNLWLLRMALL